MAPAPIAHPHLASPIAQMLTMAHGHHDQRRRRALVQKVKMPFGTRERGSTAGKRYPRGVRRPDQTSGRLLPRRRRGVGLPGFAAMPTCVVVIGLAVIAERIASAKTSARVVHVWYHGAVGNPRTCKKVSVEGRLTDNSRVCAAVSPDSPTARKLSVCR